MIQHNPHAAPRRTLATLAASLALAAATTTGCATQPTQTTNQQPQPHAAPAEHAHECPWYAWLHAISTQRVLGERGALGLADHTASLCPDATAFAYRMLHTDDVEAFRFAAYVVANTLQPEAFQTLMRIVDDPDRPVRVRHNALLSAMDIAAPGLLGTRHTNFVTGARDHRQQFERTSAKFNHWLENHTVLYGTDRANRAIEIIEEHARWLATDTPWPEDDPIGADNHIKSIAYHFQFLSNQPRSDEMAQLVTRYIESLHSIAAATDDNLDGMILESYHDLYEHVGPVVPLQDFDQTLRNRNTELSYEDLHDLYQQITARLDEIPAELRSNTVTVRMHTLHQRGWTTARDNAPHEVAHALTDAILSADPVTAATAGNILLDLNAISSGTPFPSMNLAYTQPRRDTAQRTVFASWRARAVTQFTQNTLRHGKSIAWDDQTSQRTLRPNTDNNR